MCFIDSLQGRVAAKIFTQTGDSYFSAQVALIKFGKADIICNMKNQGGSKTY